MYGKAIVFIAAVSAVSAAVINTLDISAEMPESCNGKKFCFDKSDKYPQKLMDNIISSLGEFYEVGDQIEYRDGTERTEDDCQRETRFEPIYEIVDKDGNVRFVAQSDDKFLQKIRTESCLNPGRITSNSMYFEDFQLSTWNFTCTEKRMEYSFLALSLDGTTLEDVEVKDGLPVCCSCRRNDAST